ncbi:MAG: MerR family transcriptional regulator [Myxococcales bacterium]|nr:MerR family transcriptional regulator [Myxococcales bacterium]
MTAPPLPNPARALGRPGLTIQELVRRTGVTRATVHHYTSVGLLVPLSRPNRRMAYYDASAVERIARIKQLQAQRFLPLTVIKQVLDRGGDLGAVDQAVLEQLGPPSGREQLGEVLERFPLAPAVVKALRGAGLVGDGPLSPDEVSVVAAVHAMRQAGLDERLGFEAEQMRFYREALEQLIDVELAVFNERVLGRVPPLEAARLATAAIDGSSRLLSALHRRLLRERLEEMGQPAKERGGGDEGELRRGDRRGGDQRPSLRRVPGQGRAARRRR